MRVREATFDDWEAISIIGRRISGLDTPPIRPQDVMRQEAAVFRRRWIEHPHGSRFAGVPIGWLLEDNDGRCVGTFTNHWGAYSFRSSFLRAGIASGWAVDRSHRGAPALLLLNAYVQQKGVDLLINTSAIRVASVAFEAFKAKRIPIPELDVCSFWVLKHGPFLRATSLSKSHPLPSALCTAIGLPLDAAVGAGRSLTLGRRGVRIEQVASFDVRFDRFWSDLQIEYPDRLLAYRDAASLTWHFGHRLENGSATIVTMSSGTRMLGYTVLLIEEKPSIELRRARLADLQCLDPDPSAIAALVRACWAFARDRGAAVLEVVALSPEKRKALSKLWPLRRRLPSWPYLYKAQSEDLARELDDGRVWDPSAYDGDASL